MKWWTSFFSLVACSAMAAEFRVATFNAALFRDDAGALIADCQDAQHPQVRAVAQVIGDVHADVILINEFDYDVEGVAARAFLEQHLKGIYLYWHAAPVNTGVASGADLNHDGDTTDPEDAFGYGKHPGQYGMLLLSRYPINMANIRTFQKFLWRDLPGNLLPQAHYGDAAKQMRLSSKSHWDVPIQIEGKTLHCLCSHPTPPAFDDGCVKDLTAAKPIDWNGRRNHDEILFWAKYIDGTSKEWLVDDQGRRGGLAEKEAFVILGDLNADPADGDSVQQAIDLLLRHPQVADEPPPSSEGAPLRVREKFHFRETKTSDFGLRCDYVLPSKSVLQAHAAAVHWPKDDALVKKASDHRAVWCDLSWKEAVPAK
jgi:endonuclease/exonuclease/phosphatase family metal-dependent hydrolase